MIKITKFPAFIIKFPAKTKLFEKMKEKYYTIFNFYV